MRPAFQLVALGLKAKIINVMVNDHLVEALLDTGSDKTFLCANIAKQMSIPLKKSSKRVILIHSTDSLVAQIVLGLDVLSRHKSVKLNLQSNLHPI